MNILELKRRLLPYGGFRNDADDDGSDSGGSELNIQSDDDDDDGAGAAQDRGDDFTPTGDDDTGGDGGEGQGDAGRSGRAIPYARFREVNESKRTVEEQLAATQRELAALRAAVGQPGAAPAAAPAAPAAPAFDLDAAEDEYTQAMMEGDAAKARAVRKQINQHIEDSTLARFESNLNARQGATLTQQVIAEAIEEYPWLDTPDGAEAMDAITALRDLKEAEGMARHEAVAHAVNTLAPRFVPTGTPSRALPTAKAPADSRQARAVQRNAAHSLMQPPGVQAGIGNRAQASQVDIEQLSEAEFDALPEAEKRKMRGD